MANQIKAVLISALCISLFIGACSTAHSGNSITFDDPFSYCAAVGTIDSPDSQYIGPKLPDSIVKAMISKGIVSPDAPPDFQKNAIWRCMNNQVWVCHFGANLPCDEKASTSTAPSQEMNAYCASNPNNNTIPAAITGRATVYEWKCASEKPEVIRQVFQVDSQGFIANFWYQLTPK